MAAFTPNVDLTVIKRLFGAVQQPGGFVVGDIIAPVIEIQTMALMQRREFLEVFSNFSVVNSAVTTQVTPGEFWQVHLFMSRTDVLDADQSITMSLVISFPGGVNNMRLGLPITVNASSAGGVGNIFPDPLILPAGATIGTISNEIVVGAGGSIANGIGLVFTRIPQ